MKLDMHCHTAEGSSDSKVPVIEYIERLMRQGYDGMLVTDHDSYGGYDSYVNQIQNLPELAQKLADFTVFKGIEYDTYDAGHFIVIMPDNVKLDILEYRGLKIRELLMMVHANGGILGPAHPCGEPFLSIFSTGYFKHDRSILKEFDFVEGFNCGEDSWANDEAVALAKQYDKPVIGGSDAHWQACVGLAYTILDETLLSNDELIAYIKAKKGTQIWGQPYGGTLKARLGRLNKILVYAFLPYNKFGAVKYRNKRKNWLSDYFGFFHHTGDKE